MTDAIIFDTHRFVRNLVASGFTERQAEALASEQVQLLNANLATKADLEAVHADLEAKITTVHADLEAKITTVHADLEAKITATRADLETVHANLEAKITTVQADLEVKLANLDVKIANVKSDLLKWMFAALIAQGGVIVTLVTLL